MNATSQPGPQPSAAKTAGIAITSLVLGIFGVTCLSILAGIPALILGIVGLSKIKNSGGRLGGGGLAIAGIVMGGLSFVLLPFSAGFGAALLLPAVQKARGQAKVAKCVNNVKQLNRAIYMYADENTDARPAKWEDLYEYLGGKEAAERFLKCPAESDPDAIVSYELVNPGKKLTVQESTAETVVIRELTANHNHRRVLGYADGHVAVVADEPVKVEK